METNLHLQEKVLQYLKWFFMCSTFFAIMQKILPICIKKTSHSQSPEAKKGEGISPLASIGFSNANNLLLMQMIFGKIGTAAD